MSTSDTLDFRWWADLLAGNNCHCVPDDNDPGVCVPCAYRHTVRLADEALLDDPAPDSPADTTALTAALAAHEAARNPMTLDEAIDALGTVHK